MSQTTCQATLTDHGNMSMAMATCQATLTDHGTGNMSSNMHRSWQHVNDNGNMSVATCQATLLGIMATCQCQHVKQH